MRASDLLERTMMNYHHRPALAIYIFNNFYETYSHYLILSRPESSMRRILPSNMTIDFFFTCQQLSTTEADLNVSNQ